MRTHLSLLCLLAASLAGPAAAQNAEPGGNLPADFYPRSACIKPDVKKVDRMDRSDALRFNRAVTDYNACNTGYLDKARNDADLVVAMVNAQVAITNGTPPPAVPSVPGNLPAGFYPASNCIKPDKAAIGEMPSTQKVAVVNATGKPASQDGQHVLDAMAAYNQRVAAYNAQTIAFGACSKDYIAKGQTDIAHIQAAVQAAIKAAE
jgi:hypothetical protein